MEVIHTSYATVKMHGPKGVITIKANQLDTLACENASLAHAKHFSDKVAQDQAANVAKTQGNSAPQKSSVSKPLTSSTPRVSMETTS
jgi:hypothetical protein